METELTADKAVTPHCLSPYKEMFTRLIALNHNSELAPPPQLTF